jgi:hypothetical protein
MFLAFAAGVSLIIHRLRKVVKISCKREISARPDNRVIVEEKKPKQVPTKISDILLIFFTPSTTKID